MYDSDPPNFQCCFHEFIWDVCERYATAAMTYATADAGEVDVGSIWFPDEANFFLGRILLYHPPWIPQKLLFVPQFPPKDSLLIFPSLNYYCRAVSGDCCVDLWRYKIHWRILETSCGLWKTVSVHIKILQSYIPSMNIPMILSLHWITESIREAAWISWYPMILELKQYITVACETFPAITLMRILLWVCVMLLLKMGVAYWKTRFFSFSRLFGHIFIQF